MALARDPGSDVFVELIGGADGVGAGLGRGGDRRRQACRHRQQGAARRARRRRWRAQAEEKGVSLNFEAAAAGGIPIIKTLREALAGNTVNRIYGILNGTCNYILTRMEQDELSFAECLAGGAAARLCRGRPDLRHRRATTPPTSWRC